MGCIVNMEKAEVAGGILRSGSPPVVCPWRVDKTMRKLVLLLTACAFGLGGYQLGRQPNSPDVWGWLAGKAGQVDWPTARQKAGKAFDAARRQAAVWFPAKKAADRPSEGQSAPSVKDSPPVACQAGGRPQTPPIPQCW